MSRDEPVRAQLARYLLGQVSQKERTEIEERYFHDDELFDELVAVENDMIDDLVRGRLAGPEKEQFETHLLSAPEGRNRIAFARSLLRSLPASVPSPEVAKGAWQPVRTSIARLAIVAALLGVVAAAAWVAMVNHKLRGQLEAANAAQNDAQRQIHEMRQQFAALQQSAAAGQNQAGPHPLPGFAVLTLALAPGRVRGPGQQATIHLVSEISQVVLLLRRQNGESSAYHVILETPEGSQVWQKKHLQTVPGGQNAIVTVEIPATVFNQGDYVLRLLRSAGREQTDELAVYSFRVLKR